MEKKKVKEKKTVTNRTYNLFQAPPRANYKKGVVTYQKTFFT